MTDPCYYDHPRPEVAALVPKDARVVVDVGCGAGALGQALRAERPGLRVFGIEPVVEQARRASERLDGVATATAEEGLPAVFPQPDCVIFADVLEHLVNPDAVLRTWRRAMAPSGTLVVSLPNVGHASVLGPLLRGSWRYKEAGVLDRTHLRFFTRDTALELLAGAGFSLTQAIRLTHVPEGKLSTAWRARVEKWAASVPTERAGRFAGRLADLWTMQFVLVARAEEGS